MSHIIYLLHKNKVAPSHAQQQSNALIISCSLVGGDGVKYQAVKLGSLIQVHAHV